MQGAIVGHAVVGTLTNTAQPAAVQALNGCDIVPHACKEIHEDKPAPQVQPC